jgi:predicted glycosyltransferase
VVSEIWYDACTGKHVRYGAAVSRRLRSLGHEVVLTTRLHPDTIPLADFLKAQVTIVGKYDPESLSSRVKEGLKRQLRFCDMFEKDPPRYAISHGSIDMCRVAFGLGIPTISTADSPHATAANKLGLPLVDHLVVSKAFPKKLYQQYGVRDIVQFKGVDEVAWVRDYKPIKLQYERPLIVVRQTETKAAYSQDKKDVTLEIANELTPLGNVVFISRYERRPRKGLIVPQEFVDSVSLSAEADLMISAGGTISREAALQGTPSIVVNTFGVSYVNDYLSKLGFPLFTVEPSHVIKLAKRHIGQRRDVKRLLGQLENPVDYIEKIVQKKL